MKKCEVEDTKEEEEEEEEENRRKVGKKERERVVVPSTLRTEGRKEKHKTQQQKNRTIREKPHNTKADKEIDTSRTRAAAAAVVILLFSCLSDIQAC